jgi:hypothetical protein
MRIRGKERERESYAVIGPNESRRNELVRAWLLRAEAVRSREPCGDEQKTTQKGEREIDRDKKCLQDTSTHARTHTHTHTHGEDNK